MYIVAKVVWFIMCTYDTQEKNVNHCEVKDANGGAKVGDNINIYNNNFWTQSENKPMCLFGWIQEKMM